MSPAKKSQRDKNIALVRERLEMEFNLAMKFIDRQVAHLFPGLLGALLNPIVQFFYRFMQRDASIRRYRHQLELIIECAEKYNGKNLDKLVDENLDRYLRTEELYVRANKRHPKFPEATAILREAFRGRLDSVARLLDGEGGTYEEVARSVYPDRQEVEKILTVQADMLEKLIHMTKKEPGLVTIPGPLRGPIFQLAENGLAYGRRALQEQLDDIYPPQGEKGGTQTKRE